MRKALLLILLLHFNELLCGQQNQPAGSVVNITSLPKEGLLLNKGHGGDIKVETKEGVGAGFTISIPLHTNKEYL